MPMTPFDRYYANLADAQARGPQTYGGDVAVASLRCFRAYTKDARTWIVDRNGTTRWMTAKMMRIEAVLLRIGSVGSGYTKTKDIAAECQCSPGYVSKMLTRFQAWGVIGVIATRGRYGKLFVFARAVGDTLDEFAEWARRKMAAAKVRAMARFVRKTNVSSEETSEGMRGTSLLYVMEETLVPGWVPATLTPFARRVVHERARLAIEDREGEAEAVAPLSEERAHYLFGVTHEPQRSTVPGMGTPLIDALGLDTTRGSGRIACPAHGEGRSKTLSWKITDGIVLLHCFAGCTFDEIRKAVIG